MVVSSSIIMTTEPKLSESEREALLKDLERCLIWGYGSVEVIIRDHRIETVNYKETRKKKDL